MCSVRATEKVRRKARRSVCFVHPSGFVNETQQSILCFSACFQSSICQVRRQGLVKCQLNSLSWKILGNQPQTLHGNHTNWKINLIFSLYKGICISLIAVRHGHSFSNLFTFHYGSPFTIDPQTGQVTESFRGFHAFFSWMKSSKHVVNIYILLTYMNIQHLLPLMQMTPLTHIHLLSCRNDHVPETLTPSWGAGGGGIATSHFCIDAAACPGCAETLSERRGDEDRRETHRTSGKRVGGRGDFGRRKRSMEWLDGIPRAGVTLYLEFLRPLCSVRRSSSERLERSFSTHNLKHTENDREGEDALPSHDLLFFSTLTWLPGKPGKGGGGWSVTQPMGSFLFI